jgi:hypothetical protein
MPGKIRSFIMIINLTTQHKPGTINHALAGVRRMLDFDGIPCQREIDDVAQILAALAANSDASHALIEGELRLVRALKRELLARGVKPVYA